MEQVKLATLDEIPEGGLILKEHGNRQILLAKIEGEVYAMDDVCSHVGGPLHEGELEDSCYVVCPWHAARFDVRNGKVDEETDWGSDLPTYRVQVRDGDVYVDL